MPSPFSFESATARTIQVVMLSGAVTLLGRLAGRVGRQL